MATPLLNAAALGFRSLSGLEADVFARNLFLMRNYITASTDSDCATGFDPRPDERSVNGGSVTLRAKF